MTRKRYPQVPFLRIGNDLMNDPIELSFDQTTPLWRKRYIARARAIYGFKPKDSISFFYYAITYIWTLCGRMLRYFTKRQAMIRRRARITRKIFNLQQVQIQPSFNPQTNGR